MRFEANTALEEEGEGARRAAVGWEVRAEEVVAGDKDATRGARAADRCAAASPCIREGTDGRGCCDAAAGLLFPSNCSNAQYAT